MLHMLTSYSQMHCLSPFSVFTKEETGTAKGLDSKKPEWVSPTSRLKRQREDTLVEAVVINLLSDDECAPAPSPKRPRKEEEEESDKEWLSQSQGAMSREEDTDGDGDDDDGDWDASSFRLPVIISPVPASFSNSESE